MRHANTAAQKCTEAALLKEIGMKNNRGMQRFFLTGLFAVIWLCALSTPAHAQITIIDIQVDENCHGTIAGFQGLQPLACTMLSDPGPGGLTSAMNYNMLSPPGLVAGDVVIREAGDVTSDVIRFSTTVGGGSLFFYSDLDGGVDALADVGLPLLLNTNVVFFSEFSLGNLGSGLIYTPVAGQPGFVANAAVPVRYTFISDAAVPEPDSLTLLASAGAGIALICLGRRHLASRTNQ
jgi:hypothetical protein